MKIYTNVFLPKNLLKNAAQAAVIIENALNGAALGARADFGVTVQTWNTVHPDFVIQERVGYRLIYTDNLIYKFVSGGTKVRYATMTPDFIAKTSPRVIGSGAGRGGVMFISKKHPRPGIKAREFELEIKDKWEKELPVIMQRAIDSII